MTTDITGLVVELHDLLTDWNGADLPDSSLPRVDILCGTVRRAADALTAQAAELVEARERADRYEHIANDHRSLIGEIKPALAEARGHVRQLQDFNSRREMDVLAIARSRDEALAALKVAEEALEPFAEAAASYDPDEGDGRDIAWSHDFTIASLRRARSALENSKARLADANSNPETEQREAGV